MCWAGWVLVFVFVFVFWQGTKILVADLDSERLPLSFDIEWNILVADLDSGKLGAGA